MKVALLGSAPSSLGLAPLGDPTFKIWGCSPGVYPVLGNRCDAFFELHRWEPPVIGNAAKQRTWFSPEYVQWMAMRHPQTCPVWMKDAVPEIPASRALPIDDLVTKYGNFFFTSSLAIMIACAIDDILAERAQRAAMASSPDPEIAEAARRDTAGYAPDVIALYGVDMAALDEYGYQRAGCQHFLLMAGDLGIHIEVPPESDLLRPMPIYGICESSHWHIKNLTKKNELTARLQQAQAQEQQARDTVHFLKGAIDVTDYNLLTWGEDRTGMGMDPAIQAQFPRVREDVLASIKPPNGELAAPRSPMVEVAAEPPA